MTAPSRLRPTRRGLLVAGAAVPVSGCSLVAGESEREPRTSGSGTPSGAAAPADDPDQALVDRVRSEIAAAAALVDAARRAQPGVASRVAAFRRLHVRHLAALPGEDVPGRRPRLRGEESAVLAAVGSRESRLQQALADAAVEARSGPLAALLASMSAAVAQQLATGVVPA